MHNAKEKQPDVSSQELSHLLVFQKTLVITGKILKIIGFNKMYETQGPTSNKTISDFLGYS
jgi:hypothetical protein